jgi:hypothetical protein
MTSAARATAERSPAVQRSAARAFLAATGVLSWVAAHRLAYALHPGGDGHGGASHSYLPLAEALAALVAAAALVTFTVSLLRRPAALRPGRPRLPISGATVWVSGAVVAFVTVELWERSFAAAPPEPVLLAGVALQVALGLAAAAGSRAALRAVVAAVAAEPAYRSTASSERVRRGRAAAPRPVGALASGAGGSRAPPAG